MIKSKAELREFLIQDAKANRRTKLSANFFGDEIWKFMLAMRKLDYYSYKKNSNPLFIPSYFFCKFRYHNISVKLGFSIPFNVCDKGFSVSHYGTVVINETAKIGKNCRVHSNVVIGATNGQTASPKLGDNVFLGAGAKVIGDISVADDVCIAAGAVVVKSIEENNTTWGGVPAKKISDNGSKECLSPLLFE